MDRNPRAITYLIGNSGIGNELLNALAEPPLVLARSNLGVFMENFWSDTLSGALGGALGSGLSAIFAFLFGTFVTWWTQRNRRQVMPAPTLSVSRGGMATVAADESEERAPVGAEPTNSAIRQRALEAEKKRISNAREAKARATTGTEPQVGWLVLVGVVGLAYALTFFPGLVALAAGLGLGTVLAVVSNLRAARRSNLASPMVWNSATAALVAVASAILLVVFACNYTAGGLRFTELLAMAHAVPAAPAAAGETFVQLVARHFLDPILALFAVAGEQNRMMLATIPILVTLMAVTALVMLSFDLLRWRARIEYDLGSDKKRVLKRAAIFELDREATGGAFWPWAPAIFTLVGWFIAFLPSLMTAATTPVGQ